MPRKSIYGVHPGVAMVQKWIEELPEKTGRSLKQWLDHIRKDGPGDEKSTRDWLKEKYGMGTNSAWWLAERVYGKTRGFDEADPDQYLKMAEEYVKKQYTGKKEALKPLYDKLLKICLDLAKDVEACPCETMVPIYRNHVIAQIKATTNTRIDFGFALRDTKCTGKLKDTGGFEKKDRISRKIEVTSLKDITPELMKWLKMAYKMDEEKAKKDAPAKFR
jgi:hypothetical protein